ncbi:MAG: AAA-like domain-containing protein [Microscillaceae bacterium]|nr:AAA-like domain-containing protein [Microscillaceae bacterium]
MRYFNTSGPNIPTQHYTLPRTALVAKGIKMVERDRYFALWAPRQTGKSTYFRLLAVELIKKGYEVCQINVENYRTVPVSSFLIRLRGEMNKFWKTQFTQENLSEVFYALENITERKLVLIIDEVEGLNPEYLGEFLHTIRNAYHNREYHALKSVILVGVSNIVGIMQDYASPFNIADSLSIPYFSTEETFELLGQHETETGQLFEEKVKAKISEITANQPGLVNGFAAQLVERNEGKELINYHDYLEVEDWYLNKAIDKNFSNILNKVKDYRPFLENLLFREAEIPFTIDRPEIKFLHTLGLIQENEAGYVEFWVPYYKKRLYNALYPYTNGEQREIQQNLIIKEFQNQDGLIDFDKIIQGYKDYVKRRGFNYFREKDENGNYKSIKEAALLYSFETYIQAFLQVAEGKSYREAHTGLGRSDLIIYLDKREYLIESKIYYYEAQFNKGKKQLAYYAKSLGLAEAVYLVFVNNQLKLTDAVLETQEHSDGVLIRSYLVFYDEEKDF